MNVTNLPTEKRIELFNKWLKDTKESNSSDNLDAYILCGNTVNLTVSETEDPNYIVPEWGTPLPEWIGKYNDKIGYHCECDGDTGIFLGYSYDYSDYYYRILTLRGISLYSCVGKIEFIEKNIKDENKKA